MTNQIRFHPFPDRFHRFHMARITEPTWDDRGAAHMTTTIVEQVGIDYLELTSVP